MIRRIPSKVLGRADNFMARLAFQLSDQCRYLPAIEASFQEVEDKSKAKFGGWSLSKSAIYTLCRHLLARTTTPTILELGSGQSTLFWDVFAKKANLDMRVITLEHNPAWANRVSGLLTRNTIVDMMVFPLCQIAEQTKARMFDAKASALAVWEAERRAVPISEYDNTRTPNAFYAITEGFFMPAGSVDAIVLDGPNGSGRSLAYPLLFGSLKTKGLVLIDDFDHYPFVPDLARMYASRSLAKRSVTPKHWILLEVCNE